MYGTLNELRDYLGLPIDDTSHDVLLERLRATASRLIDQYTNRTFRAPESTPRVYDCERGEVWLDDDLCQIDSVVDSDGQALSYTTQPVRRRPCYALAVDTAGAVTITGRWAYSVDAPADIVHATYRLAGYFYQQKDTGVFSVIQEGDGTFRLPKGLPSDVLKILDFYRRLV